MPTLLRAFAGKTERCARIVSSHVCKRLYGNDLAEARALVRKYWIGTSLGEPAGRATLRAIMRSVPGLKCDNYLEHLGDAQIVPFVYENPQAFHLKRLRETFDLPQLAAGASDEYHAMLKLGAWLGSRWDHGSRLLPEGTTDLVQVIRSGMAGTKYSCEVAARVTVQAFAAMGWAARLVGASRDGQTCEHAVMEAWSNQFSKWFVIDTDFNLLYESDGVPLSAYELCHDGPALRAAGKLHDRPLTEPKPSLVFRDLLPFYACVYIDLRSDWYSRKLKRGSPAGGDLASWWTARPDVAHSLVPKVRVDERSRFDWPVNIAWIRLDDVQVIPDAYAVRASLLAYSPFFAGFQVCVDGNAWTDMSGATCELALSPGHHVLCARVITSNGRHGIANPMQLYLPNIDPCHD